MNHYEKTISQDTKYIVFFDGVCNLCNSSVDILMRMDRHKRLKFSSLQGEYYNKINLLPKNDSMDSIIFFSDGMIYNKSNAILEICNVLGFPFSILRVFKILPVSIRDRIYEFIARNRYKWFGKKSTCRIPTQEEMERFI